jgi:hypothetical protein
MAEPPPFRLEFDLSQPQTVPERELLQMYRQSVANDQTVLYSLLMIWPTLSPGHRGITYRVADALHSATLWRHHKPVPPESESERIRNAAAQLLADDEHK